jgi:hypothetical protein
MSTMYLALASHIGTPTATEYVASSQLKTYGLAYEVRINHPAYSRCPKLRIAILTDNEDQVEQHDSFSH